jgi:DNA polymerase-3 subunit delta
MRIDSERLPQQLERGLKTLYCVHGEETLLALEAADRIRDCARAQGYLEREVLIAEPGFDWSQLRTSASSLSLFGSRRLLELRIPGGKPGNEGAEAIRRYSTQLPPDTVSLVCLPKLDRATLTSSWFEALETAGVAVTANPVLPERLGEWLAARLAQQGQHADAQTLDVLAGMVEGNLMAAHQEVQKLALLFPAGPITLEAVRSAVRDVARYDVFKLSHTLLAGDPSRVLRALEGLEGEGVAPPLLLWAITEELRALRRVLAQTQAGKPLAAALRDARVWGPRAELLPRAVRRFTLSDLDEGLLHAAAIDRMIKGLAPGDVREELLRLALRLSAPRPPARTASRPNESRVE